MRHIRTAKEAFTHTHGRFRTRYRAATPIESHPTIKIQVRLAPAFSIKYKITGTANTTTKAKMSKNFFHVRVSIAGIVPLLCVKDIIPKFAPLFSSSCSMLPPQPFSFHAFAWLPGGAGGQAHKACSRPRNVLFQESL